MLTEEQKQRIAEGTKESINTWARKMFMGPVLVELINGQTDIAYITDRDLSESDRPAVRRLVRENIKTELLKVFSEMGNGAH